MLIVPKDIDPDAISAAHGKAAKESDVAIAPKGGMSTQEAIRLFSALRAYRKAKMKQ